MNWYGSKPETPKIEVGSEFVAVVSKHGTTALARILRSEVRDGNRVLTLDRLLDRHSQYFTERLPNGERTWSTTGAFVSVLTAAEP
jgi:hypothetical protein